MKKHFSKTGIILLNIVFIASSFLSGCKKDDGMNPSLPYSGSLEMDWEVFPKDTQRAIADSTAKSNFIHSYVNIAVWNTILTVTLAVPVASFKEAFNHEAKWDNDVEKWKWEYNVPVNSNIYKAKLYGKVNGDKVNWEMYISQQNGFQNFLWYTGESKTDNSSGSWTLNKDPLDAKNFLGIEWNKNSAGTADIQYTNIIPNDPGNGGYIKYGIINNINFNAFYDIFNKPANNFTNITWNRTSKVGKVKDPKKFGDAEWHCWDATLTDAICN